MHRNHRIIAVIPAGRQRTMSLLMAHLRANSHIIDEIQMWENVKPYDDHTKTSQTDLRWIHSQADDFARVVKLDTDEPPRVPKQLNTGRFYRNTIDPDTIYIRFDDDIIWIHPEAIENLVNTCLEHDGLATFATIWNNAVISAIMQENGHIPTEPYGTITRFCMDDIAWKNPTFGEYAHRILLNHIYQGTTTSLYFPTIPAEQLPRRRLDQPRPLRFSVSCFAYQGRIMKEWADIIWGEEEETYISGPLVEETGQPNVIAGDALVSHYSFFTQREHLDTTDVLDHYQTLATDTYHDAYYKLLEAGP